MARPAARLATNAPGDFYVDDSCIDCAMCRFLAPRVFGRDDGVGLSVVEHQPGDAAEVLRAGMALVSCPTSSIGSIQKTDVSEAVRALPELMEGGVHFCGFASEKSYGASSYFIARDAGNVLIDSPRAAKPLMDRIQALGGVALMFLSHRDDVADHDKFRARFGCERLMHADDVSSGLGIERLVEGQAEVRLADDLVAIPLPGHTRGSMALLYENKFLFTGDHLWGDGDGTLGASRSVCWYSWTAQTESMERLLDYSFEWVLPGHGDPLHAESPRAMREKLVALIVRMQRRGRA
jgi:glyoxylase-like metal-dependent hydrolase (beta-lactamase superfamily II)/ferredoxin